MTPRSIVIGCLRFYKKSISPLLPPACRFEPTCSVYAVEAVETYGVLRGGWLAVCRLFRCHPFTRGGFDPVPAPNADRKATRVGIPGQDR